MPDIQWGFCCGTIINGERVNRYGWEDRNAIFEPKNIERLIELAALDEKYIDECEAKHAENRTFATTENLIDAYRSRHNRWSSAMQALKISEEDCKQLTILVHKLEAKIAGEKQ